MSIVARTLVLLVGIAYSQMGFAIKIDMVTDLKSFSREEVTACLSEIKADHAARYPDIRKDQLKSWAELEERVRKQPGLSYKLDLHRPRHDRVLAAEHDLYVYAMSVPILGSVSGFRTYYKRHHMEYFLNLKDVGEYLGTAKAEMCVMRFRWAKLERKK